VFQTDETHSIRPMIHTVSSHETQGFNTWNAGFQYMERRISIYGTQGFNTWNAQS